MRIIGTDMEWNGRIIDVLGLAWDGGAAATAVDRNDQTMPQYLDQLNKADVIVGQNFIDADCRQLAAEGIAVHNIEPKVFDTRLAFYACNAHLAGSGSYDLRSIVLLTGAKQGKRFKLDWKMYGSDLHKTCALDAASALWCYETLERNIKSGKLDKTVQILHQVAPIFARMRDQGVRLDKGILEQIYTARKNKTADIIEKYHLWEDRGKKVIKRVPIWRSDKILDICETQFGFRPADRQRKTWDKLLKRTDLTTEAREFLEAIVDLGKGANDAHWLGKAEETEDGLDFSKVGADGFIHPRYDICGSPDRAIASSPNIQNFPRPGDDPRPTPLRSAIVALDDSHLILGADFSSVETITNAIESNDWDRANAALNKGITHEGTAKFIGDAMGLTLTRQQGKAINHGFDKGESPYNLARTLFKTERPSRQQVLQCQQAFKFMLGQYPKTSKFRDELWERAADNPLVVTNAFGRKLLCFSRAKYGDAGDRFAKHDPTKKYWCSCSGCSPKRDRWKYAIAFLGRSSAFDALLRKMYMLYSQQALDGFSLPIVECHDELLFSVPRDSVEKYANVCKEFMESPIEELGGICLPSNVVWGNSWAEAH